MPGLLGYDRLGGIQYFNGVAQHLSQVFSDRVCVREAKTLPLGSIEGRAKFLATQIDEFFPKGDVHLVAHSMGGLDARRLVTEKALGLYKRVRSIVTIGTPHLGSPIATTVNAFNLLRMNIGWTAGASLLDMLRQNFNAIHDLSGAAAKIFNDACADLDHVYYLEIVGVGRAGGTPTALLLKPTYQRVLALEGPNDGVVSAVSAQRKGRTHWVWQADHVDMIGHDLNGPLPSTRPAFPFLSKYEEIVKALP